MIELLNIDCMQYMFPIGDKAIHIAVVDPPYGLKEHGGKNRTGIQSRRKGIRPTGYKKKEWDNKPPEDNYFKELFRITDNQIIFGANYFKQLQPVFVAPRRKDYALFIEMNPTSWIIWDKKGNDKSDFSDCELAWTSFNKPTTIFNYAWLGFGYLNNKQNEKKIHPTQKPVQLYRWVFENYCRKYDYILDTHLGSGSSAIAAHQTGLNLIGCEIDKDYYDAGIKRYNEAILQLKLM